MVLTFVGYRHITLLYNYLNIVFVSLCQEVDIRYYAHGGDNLVGNILHELLGVLHANNLLVIIHTYI